jgi:hypothetical protein
MEECGEERRRTAYELGHEVLALRALGKVLGL